MPSLSILLHICLDLLHTVGDLELFVLDLGLFGDSVNVLGLIVHIPGQVQFILPEQFLLFMGLVLVVDTWLDAGLGKEGCEVLTFPLGSFNSPFLLLNDLITMLSEDLLNSWNNLSDLNDIVDEDVDVLHKVFM